MMTLVFLKAWGRWFLATLAGLLGEWVLISNPWWLAAAALGTVVVFAVITAALWGDWRASRRSGARYGYTMVGDVSGQEW